MTRSEEDDLFYMTSSKDDLREDLMNAVFRYNDLDLLTLEEAMKVMCELIGWAIGSLEKEGRTNIRKVVEKNIDLGYRTGPAQLLR